MVGTIWAMVTNTVTARVAVGTRGVARAAVAMVEKMEMEQ